MGSSQWGHGFHTGHEQGHSEGFSEGKTEGLLIGLAFTVAGTVVTAIGGSLIHKHGGLKSIKNKLFRRKIKPQDITPSSDNDEFLQNAITNIEVGEE